MLQHRGSYLLDESGLPLRVSSIKFDRVLLSVSLSLPGCENVFVSQPKFRILDRESGRLRRDVYAATFHPSSSTQMDITAKSVEGKNFFREKLRPLHFTTEPSCIDRILLPALRRSFLRLDLPRACLVYELAQMAIDAPFMGTNMPSPPVDSSDRGGTQRSNRTQTACRQPNDWQRSWYPFAVIPSYRLDKTNRTLRGLFLRLNWIVLLIGDLSNGCKRLGSIMYIKKEIIKSAVISQLSSFRRCVAISISLEQSRTNLEPLVRWDFDDMPDIPIRSWIRVFFRIAFGGKKNLTFDNLGKLDNVLRISTTFQRDATLRNIREDWIVPREVRTKRNFRDAFS